MVLHYDIQFFAAVIMAILYYAVRRNSSKRMSAYYFSYMVLCTLFFLVFDGLECMLLEKGNMHVPTMKILDFFSYGFSILWISYFYFYLVSFLREYKGCKTKYMNAYMFWCAIVILAIYFLALVLDWFTVFSADGVQYKLPYILCQTDVYLLNAPALFLLFRFRKKLDRTTFLTWFICIVLPLVCQVFSMIFMVGLFPISVTCVMLFMYVSVNQETELVLHEKNIALRQQELEIQKTRQKVIMSQIQPHFLYNVLNTISILCRRNPDLAATTTVNFATYLRMNLNSVDQNEPVNFNEEMKHTQIYLELEKLRFGDALNIEYDIQTTSFYLPVLSLQPIVENAVKHGICMKEDDGTLRISTFETDKNYVIVVDDDGVGFDVSSQPNDADSHLGIANTKKRVEALCGGTMTVESEVGKGTKVTMLLPKAVNTSFKIVDTVQASLFV